MSSSPGAGAVPNPLARFPAEVQAAHQRFAATGDAAALSALVTGVLADFAPRHPDRPHPPPMGDDQRLVEDLGFDSLAIAEMVFFFEDLFGVRIENQELLALRTVGELRAFVATRIAARSAAA